LAAKCTLGALLGASLAAVAVHGATESRLQRRYPVAKLEVGEATLSGASLELGAHLVESVTHCSTCHGSDLSGRKLADDLLLGRLYAPNLTPGEGGISDWSLDDFVRLVRTGIGRDGRSALLMPSRHYQSLTDHELASILVYLRALPGVEHSVPERRIGLIARVALFAGRAPDLISAEWAQAGNDAIAVNADSRRARGRRLVSLGGCRICHGEDLMGGLHALALPGEPAPPDLTPAGRLGKWSETDFVTALRRGVTPDGRRLDRAFMPWPGLAGLSDGELGAIWAFLENPD
jgi:mono/diheme cytochrome c family protein